MGKIDSLKKIYAKIPKIECKKLCHEVCGVIPLERYEHRRIAKRLQYDPFEKQFLDLYGAIELGVPTTTSCLTCPMLKDNQCSIYDIRPLICRLYGVVKKLQCPHGCIPERWLSDAEAKNLLEQVRKL